MTVIWSKELNDNYVLNQELDQDLKNRIKPLSCAN